MKDFVTETETMIPLAWPANRQGRMLADIIHGHTDFYKGTMGIQWLIFDLKVFLGEKLKNIKTTLNIPLRVYDIIQSYKVMYNIVIITEVI